MARGRPGGGGATRCAAANQNATPSEKERSQTPRGGGVREEPPGRAFSNQGRRLGGPMGGRLPSGGAWAEGKRGRRRRRRRRFLRGKSEAGEAPRRSLSGPRGRLHLDGPRLSSAWSSRRREPRFSSASVHGAAARRRRRWAGAALARPAEQRGGGGRRQDGPPGLGALSRAGGRERPLLPPPDNGRSESSPRLFPKPRPLPLGHALFRVGGGSN